MVFNSYTFIVFLAYVLLIHYSPLQWNLKKIHLLLASYVFYAVWNPPFVLLLIFSTIVDYIVGNKLYTTETVWKRKLLLSLSLLGNLGPLIFFKYGNFLLENFTVFVQAFGIDFQPAKADIILPVGISFYTFQTMCYSLDLYYKKYKPVTSISDFALFVTFFPQLVAGPIVRPNELLPQFETEKRANRKTFIQGLFLLTLGLWMKVVLADGFLASAANDVFGANQLIHGLDAWMGVLAFSGQIFFDFGGYSTCAIGIAMCLGFWIRDNFLYPYAAVGFSDFWRRWHITLSSWLRDYVYIPLGGNRISLSRTHINLMLTMLIGGLWHGANWTFVVWGGLHGLYLVIERLINKNKEAGCIEQYPRSIFSKGFVYAIITFMLINITWVFFRAETFTSAWLMLQSMAFVGNMSELILNYATIAKVSIVILLMLISHWYMRNTKVLTEIEHWPWWKTSVVWTVLLGMLVLSQESTSTFIYFQF